MTTSISESIHASSTGLGIAGYICLNHVTDKGQTRFNKNFGCGHKALVRRLHKCSNIENRCFGSFELQRSLMLFGKDGSSNLRKSFDSALAAQQEACLKKEEIALQKKLEKTQEDYILAINFYEQYHSPRCWQMLDDADNKRKELGSEEN